MLLGVHSDVARVFDVGHDQPLKELHDNRSQCDRYGTVEHFGTGTAVAVFRQVGTDDRAGEVLKLSVSTMDSWWARTFSTCPRTMSGPRAWRWTSSPLLSSLSGGCWRRVGGSWKERAQTRDSMMYLFGFLRNENSEQIIFILRIFALEGGEQK